MRTLKTYKFVRDVDKGDWIALPRAFKAGETCSEFAGHMYGLCRDDAEMGRETVPCTLDGEHAFTCPVEFIVEENGTPVVGEYLTAERYAEIMATLNKRQ